MVLFGTKKNVCEEMCSPNMKTTTPGQCIGLFTDYGYVSVK